MADSTEVSSAQDASGGGGLVNIPFGAFGKKYFNKKEASKSRNWSAREAKRNRAFQERMYKSRFQMSMDDMEKAGLNPMLAAGMGLGGGGSPSGSMGNSAQSSSDNTDMQQGMSSASQAKSARMRAQKELDLLQSEIGKNTAISDFNQAQADKVRQNKNIDSPKEDIMQAVSGVTTDAGQTVSEAYNSAKNFTDIKASQDIQNKRAKNVEAQKAYRKKTGKKQTPIWQFWNW